MPTFNIRNEELSTEFQAGEQCLQQSLPDKLGVGYLKAYQNHSREYVVGQGLG
jgi:hypothetical protein